MSRKRAVLRELCSHFAGSWEILLSACKRLKVCTLSTSREGKKQWKGEPTVSGLHKEKQRPDEDQEHGSCLLVGVAVAV